MIIFNSDLDNTLIYSHKYNLGDSKQCVEIYQDRQISFMTTHSFELLKEVNKLLCLVPTTTRSMEQYQRLHLGIKEPDYALVSNGGILLIDGQSDERWYNESQKLVSACHSDLDHAEVILEDDEDRCFEIRRVDKLFIFTKSSKPLKTAAKLRKLLNPDKVVVYCNGTKVYILPQKLDKGTAVRRLKERLRADFIIAAGDSEFDIPMILAADRAFAPDTLADLLILKKNMVFFSNQRTFSDEILEYIIEFISKIQDI